MLYAVCSSAQAQQPQVRVSRIGFLGNSSPSLEENLVGPFSEGLRDHGYVEGRNILVEYRWAEGKYERFPALIAELIGLKVELIVTAGTPASLADPKGDKASRPASGAADEVRIGDQAQDCQKDRIKHSAECFG